MNIEGFLSERVHSNYNIVRKDKEYASCNERLVSLYELIKDKLENDGEQVIEQLKTLNSTLNGVSNLISYKRGLKDGIKLRELLSENQ